MTESTPMQTAEEIPEVEIERPETGWRVGYTLLFVVIAQLIEAVLGLVVVFNLVYALVTRREPSDSVKEFANRAASYLYRVIRYVTYNDDAPPFPFADLPEALEPSNPPAGPSEGI